MAGKKTMPERLAAFSDGVFAVIITIMVLDLKPPAEFTLRALTTLWPPALSYAVSYFFIAIIWVNHHYLFRFIRRATTRLIWWNFAHLFMIAFVPVATAWMAASKLAAAPVFVLIEIAYIAFERVAFSQTKASEVTPRLRRIATVRSSLALAMFASATAIAFLSPIAGFVLVCCVLLIYLSPRLPELFLRPAR